MARALANEDRAALPDAAPPAGLYLKSIFYSTQEALAQCTSEAGRAALAEAIQSVHSAPGEGSRWKGADDQDGDGPPVTVRLLNLGGSKVQSVGP